MPPDSGRNGEDYTEEEEGHRLTVRRGPCVYGS